MFVRGNAFPCWSRGLLCWWSTLPEYYQPSSKTLWKDSQRQVEWTLTELQGQGNNVNPCKLIGRDTVELGYNDIDFCNTSSITLYILGYQLILHKAQVFCDLLSPTYVRASTMDIVKLPVISSELFFQEVKYFENSTNLIALEKASPLLSEVAL